jgi:hypothetical protein
MPDHFPAITREMVSYGGEDRNPAVQLFGRRFFADQTVAELLVELLLVATAAKRWGTISVSEECVFPEIAILKDPSNTAQIEYSAKARVNLKMFAFLGASKLETRHKTHRDHYRRLISDMTADSRMRVSGETSKLEVLRTLESLFLGFQGVGGNRTWCAQSFIPFCIEVLAAETLWNETQAGRDAVDTWDGVVTRFGHFFSLGRHRFLARGGELLYLQICNALRQEASELERWAKETGLGLIPREYEPEQLRNVLGSALLSILKACPEATGQLASFIDTGADPDTAARTDMPDGEPRFTACGWCPGESWPEGLLFAIELLRVCEATMDSIEKLELLEIGCALQLLRSLCAQSARHAPLGGKNSKAPNLFGFMWALSDPEGEHTVVKQISRRCVNAVQRLIYDAIRIAKIRSVVSAQEAEDVRRGGKWKDPYGEADSRYGHKLFVTVAKRIGLIVPKRGAGARFVLTDKLLRFLVIALVRPGERISYETFKNLLFAHYGIAVDDIMLGKACEWCGTKRLSMIGGATDSWMIGMLDAAGMLLRLSDSCSLVYNPFGDGGKNQ